MGHSSMEVTVASYSTYLVNRDQMLTPEVIAKHRGEWLAISPDGRRILASGSLDEELVRLVEAAGENLEQVHLKFVPEEDEGKPLGGLEFQ